MVLKACAKMATRASAAGAAFGSAVCVNRQRSIHTGEKERKLDLLSSFASGTTKVQFMPTAVALDFKSVLV